MSRIFLRPLGIAGDEQGTIGLRADPEVRFNPWYYSDTHSRKKEILSKPNKL